MTKLTDAQISHYAAHGYVSPIEGLDAKEVGRFVAEMDDIERRRSADVWRRARGKPHLLIPWLNELMRHPDILDAVEDVIGPDILVWATSRFAKKAYDPAFVSWHQDATYQGLSEPNVVTAWIALTASHRQNGCLRVIPGTHQEPQIPHRETADANNLLSRGQEIAVAVDERNAVDIVLQPGNFSLHHTMLIHGSDPNTSSERRVGIAIRYIATSVRQTTTFKDSASLVRGADRFHNFIEEPWPQREFDPDCERFFDDIIDQARKRSDALSASVSQRN